MVSTTLPLLIKTVLHQGLFSSNDEIFVKNAIHNEQSVYQWPICNGAGDQIDFPRPILIGCCFKGQSVVPTQSVCTPNIAIALINKGIKSKYYRKE
jgi:hypothetical protein